MGGSIVLGMVPASQMSWLRIRQWTSSVARDIFRASHATFQDGLWAHAYVGRRPYSALDLFVRLEVGCQGLPGVDVEVPACVRSAFAKQGAEDCLSCSG